MRRLALAMVAFGVLAAAPAPVFADHTAGGCGFYATNDPTGEIAGPDTFTGVIYAAVVGADAVSCWIEVNGTEVPGTRSSFMGTGVVVGSAMIAYESPDGSVTKLCEQIGTHAVSCTEGTDFNPVEALDALTSGCTSTYVTTVGNRPIPTAPLQLPGYVLLVVGDTLVFVFCVV